MATVVEAIRAILAADAGVQAVLGDPPRFSPNMARQNSPRPYAVYTTVDSAHVQDLNAHSNLASHLFQIDVFDEDYLDAHGAMEAIRLALQDTDGTFGTVEILDIYADGGLQDGIGSFPGGSEINLARVSRDFTVWFREAAPA